MKLDLRELEYIIEGASFFACGGGVPTKRSKELLNILDSNFNVEFKALNELSPDDLICTAYAIGASGGAQKNYNSLLTAFDALEKHLGKSVVGIVPGEIGSEINALWVALNRQVALIDSDMVGGRAVPEEQMDIHSIQNLTTAPTLAVNDKGDAILISSTQNPEILEAVYRAFAISSGGYCYLAGRPMSAKNASKVLPSGTVSAALMLGENLSLCKSADQLTSLSKEICSSVLLSEATITSIKYENNPGFSAANVELCGIKLDADRNFHLYFQNENIILREGNKCLCSVPDLITIVCANSLRPLHSSELEEGIDVLVFATPALPMWRTENAIQLFGPRHFGFEYDYVCIGKV